MPNRNKYDSFYLFYINIILLVNMMLKTKYSQSLSSSYIFFIFPLLKAAMINMSNTTERSSSEEKSACVPLQQTACVPLSPVSSQQGTRSLTDNTWSIVLWQLKLNKGHISTPHLLMGHQSPFLTVCPKFQELELLATSGTNHICWVFGEYKISDHQGKSHQRSCQSLSNSQQKTLCQQGAPSRN